MIGSRLKVVLASLVGPVVSVLSACESSGTGTLATKTNPVPVEYADERTPEVLAAREALIREMTLRTPNAEMVKDPMAENVLCDVIFDVQPDGRPTPTKSFCNTGIEGYATEAERAVGSIEFAPMLERGKPRWRYNVVYPIEFDLKPR